jgi:hypothetical protein
MSHAPTATVLQPENLLFTATWELKLADFGVAINLSNEQAVTHTGECSNMHACASTSNGRGMCVQRKWGQYLIPGPFAWCATAQRCLLTQLNAVGA